MNPDDQRPEQPHHLPTPDSSEGKNRHRPSLFPLRGSARRKSLLPDDPDLFNPHAPPRREDESLEKTKSNSQYSDERNSNQSGRNRSPRSDRSTSGPKTPRSAPKQYQFDTPFVPFVHQTLSRTVWQSEEVIPQQKDEIEKKQSQSEWPAIRSLTDPHQTQGQETHVSDSQEELTATRSCLKYPDLGDWNNNIRQPDLSVGNRTEVSCASEQPADEIVQQVEGRIQYVEIPVSAHVADACQQTSKRKLTHSDLIGYSYRANTRRLGLSNITCISIPPAVKLQSDGYQQTDSIRRTVGQRYFVTVKGYDRSDFQMQTSARQLSTGNSTFLPVRKSVRKSHTTQQTIPLNRNLNTFSRVYDEKVSDEKVMQSVHQQTFGTKNTRASGMQTDMGQSRLQIHQQAGMNMMVQFDYTRTLDEKIANFEALIRDLAQSNRERRHNGGSESIGIQCNAKDLQNRTSLKRVSIADTKIIYDIEQSQSMRTVDSGEGKGRKSSGHNKKKASPREVKIEYEEDSEQYCEKPNKKSRRKQGKTPGKKTKK